MINLSIIEKVMSFSKTLPFKLNVKGGHYFITVKCNEIVLKIPFSKNLSEDETIEIIKKEFYEKYPRWKSKFPSDEISIDKILETDNIEDILSETQYKDYEIFIDKVIKNKDIIRVNVKHKNSLDFYVTKKPVLKFIEEINNLSEDEKDLYFKLNTIELNKQVNSVIFPNIDEKKLSKLGIVKEIRNVKESN